MTLTAIEARADLSRRISWRARLLACAPTMASATMLAIPSALTAQTVGSSFGPVNPSYNVETQQLGTDIDQLALQVDIRRIIDGVNGNPNVPEEAKAEIIRIAIDAALREATGGVAGVCSQQLDPIVSSLSIAGAATALGGNIAELVGSNFVIANALTAGLAISTASSGIAVAEASISASQINLPNCDADFAGTIRGYANLATAQGISAHNGAISLGNPDGTTYQRGIAIGGGAVSGAGEGAIAQTTTPGDVAIGNGAFAGGDALALGLEARASGFNTTALGTRARATATGAVAVGQDAGATEILTTAIGANSIASGIASTSVGNGAVASGFASNAIGANAGATARSTTALGEAATASANNSIAIGGNSLASGNFSTALGQASRATGASSLAAGQGATAETEGAVALGAGAAARAQDSVAIGRGSNADQSNTVSIGRVGAERRIVNLAAGIAPTDAANVGQLNAVAAQTQGNSDAIGALTVRVEANTVAINVLDARVTDNTDRIVVLEADVTDNSTRIVALEDGRAGPVRTNAAPGASAASATGDNSLAAGSGAVAAGGNTMAIGTSASASGTASLALGTDASASANGSVAIGEGAQASGTNSVAIGAGSTDEGEDNVVSLGGRGATRRIANVGPGIRATDAVNLAQLVSASNQTLLSANTYTDLRIAEVRFDLGQLRQDTDAATASSMAIATIPQAIQPGRGMFGIGTATWQGETAIALGISKATADGDFVVNLRASINSRGDGGAAGGVGFSF